MFALACASPTPTPASSEPITLTIGIPQSKQRDPTHSIATLANALSYQRLTASDAAGRTHPLLIERWTTSRDGLTWRLVLRSNILFHDGSRMTASDVQRSLERTTQDPARAAFTSCQADVTDVSAVSDREIVVRLARPCAIFLDDLDYSVTKTGPDGATIGTGPFVTKSVRPDDASLESISLDANASYFLGKPAIDHVEVRAYDTLREAWAEMLRGRIDFLWEVGPEAAEFLRQQTSVELRSHVSYFVYTIALNASRPPLDRTDVRQALNLAIDRETLLEQALRGQGIAAASPIWPSHWARPERAQALPYTPSEAAAGLARAMGRPLSPRTSAEPVLSFTCLLPEGFTVYEKLALLVQQQLRAINVDMRLEALPSDAFNERIGTGDFDAVLIPLLGGPSLSVHYRLWHSPSPSPRWNSWGYRSAPVDRALDDLRAANGPDGIRSAVAALDAALRADPPGVVLVWSEALQAVSRRFRVPEAGKGRDALHVLWAWTPSGAGGP